MVFGIVELGADSVETQIIAKVIVQLPFYPVSKGARSFFLAVRKKIYYLQKFAAHT